MQLKKSFLNTCKALLWGQQDDWEFERGSVVLLIQMQKLFKQHAFGFYSLDSTTTLMKRIHVSLRNEDNEKGQDIGTCYIYKDPSKLQVKSLQTINNYLPHQGILLC